MPHSVGDAPTPAPVGAVDCHHHIFDPRFQKSDESQVPPAAVADYRLFKAHLGISRSVVVTSSNYQDDSSCLVDALDQFGRDGARGVATVYPGGMDADDLHSQGVRRIRVYLAKGRVPTFEEMRVLADQAAARGWSINLVSDRHRELLLDWEETLMGFPCPIVIDHLGWTPRPAGRDSALVALIRRPLAQGKNDIKLSGPYLSSVEGPPALSDSDVDELAAELAELAPDRAIWGLDWPHPVAQQHGFVLDGAALFDQLSRWVPDAEKRQRILFDDPQRLY